MTTGLQVVSCGPAVTVQDLGRPGHIAAGLTRGGAMDPVALHEAAALLEQPVTAALEMTGLGGVFEIVSDIVIALTGAPMHVRLNGSALRWNAAHALAAGTLLDIGGVTAGSTGYLSVAGGFDTEVLMGARAAHVSFGIGAHLRPGDCLPVGPNTDRARAGYGLVPTERFTGGTIRMVRSLQSDIYGDALIRAFTETEFTRDARANRQGIRMTPPKGVSFLARGGLTVVSEIIAPGDIQVTGDGAPFVLMREHQTTGGYPRIGTVIPCDLPKVAQAPLGAQIRFELLSLDAAIAAEHRARTEQTGLPSRCAPIIRDPADIANLLGYTLTSGFITGQEEDTL